MSVEAGTTSVEGVVPLRAPRKAVVADLPNGAGSGPVKISLSTHELTFVSDISKIDSGPLSGIEVVRAWQLTNGILTVKGILQGGNLVSIVDQGGKEYIWLNKEGATNYGAGSDAFPLTRGLILHGGIRVAAVTAEHGLYYDTDWDLKFEITENSASLIFSIFDNEATRASVRDPFSSGQYLAPGNSQPMSKYPVTNALFTFKITLNADENFVRLYAGLESSNPDPIHAEIWLPQTYPITRDSQIISHQKKRRVKDLWVYQGMIKDKYVALDQSLDKDKDYPSYKGKNGFILGVPTTPAAWGPADLLKPLDWPNGGGGILYDYPYRDGEYHAISYGDGRGSAYVTVSNENRPHYTKIWSWGNPDLFNRTEALKQNPPLAAGRPKKDYYEPWGSAYNTGFFEPAEFVQGVPYGWEAFILPIASGLDPQLSQEELQKVVDEHVEPLLTKLN